jgi:hypothetical protein
MHFERMNFPSLASGKSWLIAFSYIFKVITDKLVGAFKEIERYLEKIEGICGVTNMRVNHSKRSES